MPHDVHLTARITRPCRRRSAALGVAIAAAALAGCSQQEPVPAPPRAAATANLPVHTSSLTLPVSVSLDLIEAELNRLAPRTLWQVDKEQRACVRGARVAGIKVTPDLKCRIVGHAVRGPIRLTGKGDRLRLRMPVRADVRVSELALVIHETADAEAILEADVRLSPGPDWRPRATIEIDYSWTERPGAELLGRRIDLAGKVDPKLERVFRQLEGHLEQAIAAQDTRRLAEQAWRAGFTVIEVNKRNPPVFMRFTPQAVGYGGYRMSGRTVTATLSARAQIETFVGRDPPPPLPATPLPSLLRTPPAKDALKTWIPVAADYAELVPPLRKALGKVAAKGITLPDGERLTVRFDNIDLYGTTGGRLAVGLDIDAERATGVLRRARGRVWVTAMPYNAIGSQRVVMNDVEVDATTDSRAVNLLISVARSAELLSGLSDGLSEDFSRDYNRIVGIAQRAITEKRVGPVVFTISADRITNGRVLALGQGLWMPVEVDGRATLRYDPLPATAAR